MSNPGADINYLYTLAGQHYEAGRMQEAANIYAQILKINPQHTETQYMLGMVFYRSGLYEKADVLVSAALAANTPDAHIYSKARGDIMRGLSRTDEAMACYKKAIDLNPQYPEALNNLASMYLSSGDLVQAELYFSKVIAIRPDYVPALYNMGLIYQKTDRRAEAHQLMEKTVSLRPQHAEAWKTLAELLIQSSLFEGAEEAINKSIGIAPSVGNLLIGSALANKRFDYKVAIEQLEAALRLEPENFDAMKNLGALYGHLEMYEKSCALCEKALLVHPQDSELLNNLGNVYKGFGYLDKSISCYKRAIESDPDDSRIYSNLLLAMIYSAETSPEEIARVSREYGELIERTVEKRLAPERDTNPERKLRIGYVSPDFRKHSVNYFFEHVLDHHDRTKFAVYGYSSAPDEDDVTERLKSKFDVWHRIANIKNDDAAALIDEDKIDILIDMAGHTANNKLLVFARKPAPVQVSWLGYPATTGIKTIDYRITDNYAEPTGMTEALNTERLFRLPDIFCCYGVPGKNVPVIEHPPFEDNGYITFGCFNTFTKVTDPVLDTWRQVMERVPLSRLLLEIRGIEQQTRFREDVFKRLHAAGLPMDRVILEPWRRENQFVLYNSIDIALDPFPCAGGTTSMDTLWMGVPFVTLAGRHFVSRMGVTILSNAGLPDLIAQNIEEYVEKAAALATDLPRLRAIRHDLRKKVMESPLMDGRKFTANLENAYRQMWRYWCEKR